MSVINATPLLAAAGGEYEISRSVRLRSSASAYFNRTLTTPTNNKIWTWSGWVKRGSTIGLTSGADIILGTGTGSVIDEIRLIHDNGASGVNDSFQFTGSGWNVKTLATKRDPSAWQHFIVTVDTTQATAANRVRLYCNGIELPYDSATYPTQNSNTGINSATLHNIGARTTGGAGLQFDGYLTEVNFIDGQALTPSSFGETDAITGVWKPKKYAGTYGTNGFYLNFSDNSAATAAAIGKDNSGNGNNWTPNNISVTSGVTYDSMIDSPTMYADGGNGRGNYATLNPVFKNANATYGVMATPSDGNLNATMGSGTNVYSTMALPTSGKIYVECEAVSWTSQLSIGFMSDDGNANRSAWWNNANGIYVDNAQQFAGATSTGIIGIAVDCDAKTVQFYRDNSARGSAYVYGTGSVSAHLFWAYTNSGATVRWNFGQRPFAYTPPTGFKALNTQNLPDATIKKGNAYFDATTYTGNGTSQSIVNSGAMQPDLVWAKQRSSTQWHRLIDAVRGSDKVLYSNDTSAEFTDNTQLTSFNSNGFSVGSQSGVNASAATYVGWQWKAAGSTVSNTSGSITSTVSANTSAGFSIVSFVNASGTNQATVGHGLGVAPKLIISKNRDTGANNWAVFHASVCDTTSKFLKLNTTDAVATYSTVWGAALPTSSVFGVTGGGIAASSVNVIAYCFAEVAGYSKFGSYTGNGSSTDGPFVYLGFRPRFILTKNTTTGGYWWEMVDSAREPINPSDQTLYANVSDAEYTSSAYNKDFLSNGFKIRGNSAGHNASGDVYIYAAFAENPFKNSLAR